MKVIAYLQYIGDDYYCYRCYSFELGLHNQTMPHGLVDEKDLDN